MKLLHVNVETDDGWLIAQGLEEPAIITQAKSIDELVVNVRDAAKLLRFGRELHIVLIIPPQIRSQHVAVRRARKAG